MSNLDDELIELRREIHRHPELAGEERATAGLVAEQLRAAGLEVTTGVGGHGVVAVLDGSVDAALSPPAPSPSLRGMACPGSTMSG